MRLRGRLPSLSLLALPFFQCSTALEDGRLRILFIVLLMQTAFAKVGAPFIVYALHFALAVRAASGHDVQPCPHTNGCGRAVQITGS